MITTGFWPESIDLFSGGIGFGGLCFFTYLGFVFASPTLVLKATKVGRFGF